MLLAWLVVGVAPAQAAGSAVAGHVFTIAGTGTAGLPQLRKLATASQLTPVALASDGTGGFFASVKGGYVVHVFADGALVRIAGNGAKARGTQTGDGGAAVDAHIDPSKISLSATGSLLVANTYPFGSIRQISPDGVITTIAGSNTPAFATARSSSKTTLVASGTPFTMWVTSCCRPAVARHDSFLPAQEVI